MKLIQIPLQILKNGTFALCICALFGTPLLAGSQESAASANQPLPTLVNPLLSARQAMADKGVTFKFSYIGDTFSNLSGGYNQGTTYKGSLLLGVNLDLEKLFVWKGSSFYASILYPHGGSITNEYVHDFNGISNIDSNDDLRLYEWWFQQSLANDKVSLRIGMLAADLEFFVSDNSSVFINSAFGTTPLLTKQDFDAPFIPNTAPGIRLRVNATPSLSFLAGVFSGDIGQSTGNNKHGLRISFDDNDGALVLFEADYRANQQDKSEGLTGTYKLCGFYQTADFANNSGRGSEHGNCGCCLIVDQQILATDKSDRTKGLGLFSHIGAAPADRNVASCYCDAGLNYKGLFATRDKDVCGMGISFTKISDELRDPSGVPVQSHHETVIEATYQAVINDCLTLQPDIQYIINPGATSPAKNATVAGVRFVLTF